MQRRKTKRNNIFIVVGTLLIFFATSYLIFNYYSNERLKQQDNDKVEEFFEVEEEKIEEVVEEVVEEPKEGKQQINYDYIAVLEIPKINLKRGIYAKNSKLNNVDKSIYLLKESNMPDEEKGNFILAAHSGSAYVSYFRNLPKLSINDIAYVYYNGGRYGYILVNNYEIIKNGKANIIRNGEKNTMTLITCKHNTDKQLTYIFELMEDE